MKHDNASQEAMSIRYSQYVWSRILMMGIVYTCAMILAYIIPSYTDNMYLIW